MESTSPDKSTVAVVFERDCGATTAKNTQICFRQAEEMFDPKKQSSFLVFEGEQRPKLAWRDSNKLTVTLPVERKIYCQEATSSGIAIEYADGDR
jgi:hypothetical protein